MNPSTRTACITGATSGLGRAFARQLAQEGYNLILTGRREGELHALATDLAGPANDAGSTDRSARSVHVLIGDLTDPAVRLNIADTLATCADLSLFIHNAGFGHPDGFFSTSAEDLRDMGEVHMQCAVQLVRAAYPAIQKFGKTSPAPPSGIILVSSLAAFLPAPGPAMYTASKHFLVGLGRALQPEAADAGVPIQVLCPGFTHTEFHDRLNWSAESRKNRGIARWMDADDVARRSLRALHRRRGRDPVYIPGFSNRLIRFLTRLLPWSLYRRIVASRKFL